MVIKTTKETGQMYRKISSETRKRIMRNKNVKYPEGPSVKNKNCNSKKCKTPEKTIKIKN